MTDTINVNNNPFRSNVRLRALNTWIKKMEESAHLELGTLQYCHEDALSEYKQEKNRLFNPEKIIQTWATQVALAECIASRQNPETYHLDIQGFIQCLDRQIEEVNKSYAANPFIL